MTNVVSLLEYRINKKKKQLKAKKSNVIQFKKDKIRSSNPYQQRVREIIREWNSSNNFDPPDNIA